MKGFEPFTHVALPGYLIFYLLLIINWLCLVIFLSRVTRGNLINEPVSFNQLIIFNKFNHCADFMTTLIFQPFGKWSLINKYRIQESNLCLRG